MLLMHTFSDLHSRFRSALGPMLRFLVGLSTVLLTAAISVGQTQTLSPEARRDLELRPGVVLVYIQLQGAFGEVACKGAWSGTGFLYRPDGYLITNGHVAQLANAKDADALTAQKIELLRSCLIKKIAQAYHRQITLSDLPQIAAAMRLDSKLTVFLNNGSHYDGEIKAYSDPITSGGKDVAVIKIDANNLPTVPLGDSDAVNVNDRVFVIGYPGAAAVSEISELVATSSDGIISAVKNKDYSGTPLLQTNANINHGNSGGPAFDSMGRVIGIATFGKEAPGFNFLVPISTAKEFIRQAGGEPERGAFDKKWHAALDAYASEQWTTAHELASSVLEMEPNQPEAKRLQAEAAAQMESETWLQKEKERPEIPALIGIGAVVLLGGGLIVWLLMRGKKAAAPPAVRPVDARIVAASVKPAAASTIIEAAPAPKPLPTAPQSFGVLHVSGGSLTGNRFPIPKAGLLIGRDPARCGVVVPEDSVGKEHAWVVPLDNGVAVIDRNSVNGTYVNSTDSPRINKVVLRHGDRIFLGKTSGTVFTYYNA